MLATAAAATDAAAAGVLYLVPDAVSSLLLAATRP